jgi:hypothetical protein
VFRCGSKEDVIEELFLEPITVKLIAVRCVSLIIETYLPLSLGFQRKCNLLIFPSADSD